MVPTRAPEVGYGVSIPELPDVTTQGETREKALAMVKEASYRVPHYPV